jgi:peptide/nickel transport system permease protein
MATSTSTGTEFSADEFASAAEGEKVPPGLGPWRLAGRRLRRNKVALFFGGLFLLIVILCLLAPVYSSDIAHISPNAQNIVGANLNKCPPTCVNAQSIPVGPTWHRGYFFGADSLGRDVAVRLFYGGRNSLEIGAIATLITMIVALALGLTAGYFRGIADGILSRVMDVIWAFPVLLLGIALGTILAVQGIGPLKSSSLLVPALVIGLIYIPYVGKPVRGQVLTLREREFIDAARQQGLSHFQIMFREILPNLASTIVVFIPLILANAILLEAGLTFLSAGVQPPNPSWGTMITDGINQIPVAFHNVLVPGIMLVLCVLSINVFGDGLRDALDPRAKVRVSH